MNSNYPLYRRGAAGTILPASDLYRRNDDVAALLGVESLGWRAPSHK
jgi:hypothetical protein